jgi:hypothetical protein
VIAENEHGETLGFPGAVPFVNPDVRRDVLGIEAHIGDMGAVATELEVCQAQGKERIHVHL